MEWTDLFWGFWNGITGWVLVIVHIFGGWREYPFYDAARSGNWYDVGFLIGAGSPILGGAGGSSRATSGSRGRRQPESPLDS